MHPLRILALAAPLSGAVQADDGSSWQPVNDDVMGGQSTSEMVTSDSNLRFEGVVSLANGGGFASVRRTLTADLSDRQGLRLRVQGDGRRYQVRLRPDDGSRSIAYRYTFPTDGTWQELVLPFSHFEPVFRGRLVADAGPLRPASMRLISFMTAEKTAGPFRLDIGAIQPF